MCHKFLPPLRFEIGVDVIESLFNTGEISGTRRNSGRSDKITGIGRLKGIGIFFFENGYNIITADKLIALEFQTFFNDDVRYVLFVNIVFKIKRFYIIVDFCLVFKVFASLF